ncbi:hypothetical protein CEXT_662751 [Caerostris extrusa]|uniref:Uncharacterized protein n=1 Tax=Caerostris extrusa TaxID=172846 RepID=A0AAV4Y092_CAEEX|nr:hypothetical protein CEXT_662751 [Caerostris extrusa]
MINRQLIVFKDTSKSARNNHKDKTHSLPGLSKQNHDFNSPQHRISWELDTVTVQCRVSAKNGKPYHQIGQLNFRGQGVDGHCGEG